MTGIDAFFLFNVLVNFVALIVWCIVGEKYLNNKGEIMKCLFIHEKPEDEKPFKVVEEAQGDNPPKELASFGSFAVARLFIESERSRRHLKEKEK